jgi:hypothetical protein
MDAPAARSPATAAVAAGGRSVESLGAAAEGTPVSCATAGKILVADAIGSTGTSTRARSAICGTGSSRAVGDAGAAGAAQPAGWGRPAGEISTLPRDLLPGASLALR